MIFDANTAATRGMTLIEVLITLSILATALLALASLQRYTYASNALAGQRSEAVSFAHEQLDNLRTILGSNPLNVTTNGQDTIGPPASGSTVEIKDLTTLFDRTWTILLLKNSRLVQINVDVSWHDNIGDPHDISLDSILTLTTPLASTRIII